MNNSEQIKKINNDFVYIVESKIVGAVICKDINRVVYVLPEFRRKGIATKLVKASYTEKEAFPVTKEGHLFFKHLGFNCETLPGIHDKEMNKVLNETLEKFFNERIKTYNEN